MNMWLLRSFYLPGFVCNKSTRDPMTIYIRACWVNYQIKNIININKLFMEIIMYLYVCIAHVKIWIYSPIRSDLACLLSPKRLCQIHLLPVSLKMIRVESGFSSLFKVSLTSLGSTMFRILRSVYFIFCFS